MTKKDPYTWNHNVEFRMLTYTWRKIGFHGLLVSLIQTVPCFYRDNWWTSSKTLHQFLSGIQPDSQNININWWGTFSTSTSSPSPVSPHWLLVLLKYSLYCLSQPRLEKLSSTEPTVEITWNLEPSPFSHLQGGFNHKVLTPYTSYLISSLSSSG